MGDDLEEVVSHEELQMNLLLVVVDMVDIVESSMADNLSLDNVTAGELPTLLDTAPTSNFLQADAGQAVT